VESDPRGPALNQNLIEHSRPIRADSDVSVPAVRLDGLETALRNAHRSGHVVRGLEGAEQTLAAEERGLRLADRKSDVKRGDRVSRLLLLADDGSDGFYRKVETLLMRHRPRALALRLNVDAAGLGGLLFGEGNAARLLMVQHKEAVAEVLFALADQFASD
jgi:hypothetical protein